MKTKSFPLWQAVYVSVLFALSENCAAQSYQLTNLGALLGTNSYAHGINNQGQVVGYWRTTNGVHAFLYSGGVMIDLGALGDANAYALSINNPGQVVGFGETPDGIRAFLMGSGGVTNLGSLGGLNSYAFGINGNAEVVGHIDTPDGARAFLYRGGAVTNLGTLGGTNSYAYGVNNLTQVAGSSANGGHAGMHAFLWQNGRLINLNSLVPENSGWELQEARGINDNGQIVGWGSHNGQERSFLYDNGRITDLGLLPGGTNSYALALNNSNQVVGVSSIGDGTPHAFVWRNGVMSDLNDFLPPASGWELREARGINDGGEIVGWGTINGEERAFLLTPQPAPEDQIALDPANHRGKLSVRAFSLATESLDSSATNSPLADAHVRDGASANTNFGTNTVMELQTSSTTGNNRDVYFKFDISNAPVPLGTAKLRVFASLSGSGSVITTAYSVSDTNWTESGITWNNKPALGSALTNQTFNVKTGASYDIDVSAFIRSEQNAGRGTITLALHCTNNTTLLASINSKENASNKPQLILNTNTFPTVSISSPTNNSSFPAPTNLTISATASDPDGAITNVEFFAGALLIDRDATSPYSIIWSNAPVGTYALTARATDNFGATSTSTVVNITMTTNLITIADAHVTSASPTNNFGTNTLLEVQTNGVAGPTRDTYLKFDLSSVTNLSSAKLRIFGSLSGSGTVGTTVYSVTDTSWGETNITWNNKPARSNALNSVNISGTTATWYVIDVSSFVQSEKAAGRDLITLALHCLTNSTPYIKINSRQAASNKPELLIAETNSAPSVSITNPANNAIFVAPVDVQISATASDNDGAISQVEFFQGSNSLGVRTSPPYSLTWGNVGSGTYTLTARATDNYGLTTTSTVVSVTVDMAPAVSLTAPTNGANFPAYPTNITLSANATDGDGVISQVEFFQGSTSLGVAATSPYQITWSNVVGGVYALTARATDNLGVVSTSAVNKVTVGVPPGVTLTSPTNGSTFTSPTNIVLTATASDTDGTVSRVDFYAWNIWIGSSSVSPYSVTWSNVAVGAYALTTVATDNDGLSATSSVVNITVTLPQTGSIKLWLRADAISGLTNGARVATWPDSSGLNNNASQGTTSYQPLFWTNVVNAMPVVRFDGADDYFGLPNFLNGTTQAEAFVVLKATVDTPSTPRSLWRMGTGSYGDYYPSTDGIIYENFGSSARYVVGNPAQPLDQYHLYNVAGKAGELTARINGIVQYSTTINTYGYYTAPVLGVWSSTFFAGDVGEVLIYSRVLNSDERDAVNTYLNAKYGLVTNAPASPTNLTASAVSATQVSLRWDFSLGNASTVFKIERKTGAGGTYSQIAALADTTSYLDTNLTASTIYYYRVKASNSAGDSAYSNEANATTAAGGADLPLSNIKLWLKAEAGVTRQGTNSSVEYWLDQSGSHADASQVTASSQPLWVDGAANGRPVVRFDGADDYFALPNFLNGTTQAEAFVVLKATVDTPSTPRSLWRMGTGSYGDYYPSTDGIIYENFGSSTRYVVGNPAQPLDQYHLYNVAGKAGELTARINGIVQYSTTINTYGYYTAPVLGVWSSTFFAGDVAEVVIFNRVLTSDERDAVAIYLNQKYGFVPAVPDVPAGLTASAIGPNQVSLSWTNRLGKSTIIYKVERSSGGAYSQIAAVQDATSFLDTNVVANTQYTYRIKAANYVGESAYSTEASVTTPANGSAIPVSSLLLWLKADTGVIRLNTNNSGTVWKDQRDHANDASQSSIGNQPQLVER